MSSRLAAFASAEAVEDAFYEALRKGDLTALMSLWADDDDVLCIHPGGPRLRGLAAVRASWAEILRDGGMAIRPLHRHCTTGGSLAVHHVVEAIEFTGEGGRQTLFCEVTNVFAKDALGWRMLAHHASPPGETASGDAATPPDGILH